MEHKREPRTRSIAARPSTALNNCRAHIEAKLETGSTFATEAELLSQFNVSRPTLRESLKLLESQGVIELRPGPGGGIIVREPSTDLLAHGLSVFLRINKVPFVTVIKAREVIETDRTRTRRP